MKKQTLYTALLSSVVLSLFLYWAWSPITFTVFDGMMLTFTCLVPFIMIPFVMSGDSHGVA